MKIAICDDSLTDAHFLRDICKKSPLLPDASISVFECGEDLISSYENGTADFDLVFLDVDMSQIDGISLGKKIKEFSYNTILVFVTSYPQFAIEAYDCEAFHYILKPVGCDKVFSVLERAFFKYQRMHQYHIVRVKNQTYRIPVKDIYYIECCRKHVIYHLKDRDIETVGNLSSVYENLSDFGFYQIHQGYVINFDKVYEFRDYSVILDDGRSVMISVRKKKEVLIAYAKYASRFV